MAYIVVPGAGSRTSTVARSPVSRGRHDAAPDRSHRLSAPRGMLYGALFSLMIWALVARWVLHVMYAW